MKKIILILIFNLFAGISAELINIKISPLNRAYLFFNEIPNYQAELNDIKDRIIIDLSGTEIEKVRQLNSTGLIKSITPIRKDGNTQIIIEFSSKDKGFTLAPLPYSKSLIIDVFDWNRLSESETKFRQAIFAYEAGLETTEEELRKAIDAGSSHAKAFLAFHQLKNGELEKAQSYIFEANRDSVKIPDLWAAISEILKIKEKEDLRMDYLQRFKKFTDLSSFPSLALSYESENIVIPDYFYKKEQEITKEPSATQSKKELVKNDSTQKTEQKSFFEKFGIDPLYMIFVGIAAIILLGFLYWTYTKWKKEQINKIKEISKIKFEEEVRQAREKNEAKAEELRRKREEQAKKNSTKRKGSQKQDIFSKKYGGSKNKTKDDIPNLKQKKLKPVKNVEEEKKQSDIEKFLESYIPAKKEIEKDKDKKISDDEFLDDLEDKKSNSPGTDLALKLAGEKHKKKQEQLMKLAKEKLNSGDSDIEKTAKDMGLEKGSLETKNSLNKLSEDEKRLKKLNDKFDPDNNKDSDES